MEEIWAPIQGAPKYDVSSLGNVRIRLKSGCKDMRIQRRVDGRPYVTLTTQGRQRELYIDELLTQHFG